MLAFPELDDDVDDEDDHDQEEEKDKDDGEDEESEDEHPANKNDLTDRPQAAGRRSVPEFFIRMAATESADLKVRIVLKAAWVDDGMVDGIITETRVVLSTFADEFGDEDWAPLPQAERSRIQMIYIPASRDGRAR